MVARRKRTRSLSAFLSGDRGLVTLSVLCIAAAVGVMAVSGEDFLGRILVAESSCGAEPSWTDCEVKECKTGSSGGSYWECTKMKAGSSYTSTSGTYSGGMSVESCRSGCSSMTSATQEQRDSCNRGCDSMGTSGSYPSGTYSNYSGGSSGGGYNSTMPSGSTTTTTDWCAKCKADGMGDCSWACGGNTMTSTSGGSGMMNCTYTDARIRENGTERTVIMVCDNGNNYSNCHEGSQSGPSIAPASIQSAGVPSCSPVRSGGTTGTMPSGSMGGMSVQQCQDGCSKMPNANQQQIDSCKTGCANNPGGQGGYGGTGNYGGMTQKNCTFPKEKIFKNGQIVEMAVWCSGHYTDCHEGGPNGPTILSEQFRSSNGGTCETGTSGGQGGTTGTWDSTHPAPGSCPAGQEPCYPPCYTTMCSLGFSCVAIGQCNRGGTGDTSKMDPEQCRMKYCTKYGTDTKEYANCKAGCYGIGGTGGSSGGGEWGGGNDGGDCMIDMCAGTETSPSPSPSGGTISVSDAITKICAAVREANTPPYSACKTAMYNLKSDPINFNQCVQACWEFTPESVDQPGYGKCKSLCSSLTSGGGTGGGGVKPQCMAPSWSVKCNSEECKKYGSKCRPSGGSGGGWTGGTGGGGNWGGNDKWSPATTASYQGPNIYDFYGFQGDNQGNQGPSAEGIADIKMRAKQNCGFGWGNIDHATLDPLKAPCEAEVDAYVDANPNNPQGAFEIGNEYHRTVYAEAQQKTFAKQMCSDVKKYGLVSMQQGIDMATKTIAKVKAAGKDTTQMEAKLSQTKEVLAKATSLVNAGNCEEAQMLIGQWQNSMQQFNPGFDAHEVVAQQFSGQFRGANVSQEDLGHYGFADLSDAATLFRNGGVTADQFDRETLNMVQVSNLTVQDINVVAQLTQQVEELKKIVAGLSARLSSLLQQIAGDVTAGPQTTAYIDAIAKNVDEKSLTPERQAELRRQVLQVAGRENMTLFGLPFNDFSNPGAWYVSSAVRAKKAGIFEGNPDGSFAAERPMNRAEITVATAHALGGNLSDNAAETVSPNVPSWAGPAVVYLQENYPDLLTIIDVAADPAKPVTRLQLARIFTYLLKANNVDVDLSAAVDFPDTDDSAFDMVSAAGLMTGQGNGNADPNGIVNRGQVAKVFVLFNQLRGVTATEPTDSASTGQDGTVLTAFDGEQNQPEPTHEAAQQEQVDPFAQCMEQCGDPGTRSYPRCKGECYAQKTSGNNGATSEMDFSFLTKLTYEQAKELLLKVQYWNSLQKGEAYMTSHAIAGRKYVKELNAWIDIEWGSVRGTTAGMYGDGTLGLSSGALETVKYILPDLDKISTQSTQ